MSNIRDLKAQIEELEGENINLRSRLQDISGTVQEAVSQERGRNLASNKKDVAQLEEIIRALQAKNAAAQEESHDKLTRIRARYEETFKKRVERIRFEMQEEMNEKLAQLTRRHREEVTNRQKLYEEEIRTLLREMDRLRGGGRGEDFSLTSRNQIPSPQKPSRYPTSMSSARASSNLLLSSPSALKSSSRNMSPKDGRSPPVRAQLSRQYASQLESYIKKNKVLHSPSTDVGARSKSSPVYSSPQRKTAFSSRYRFPTPPEYETLYKRRGGAFPPNDEDKYPRDSLESPLRFPTPPEYKRFFEKNAPDEVDVDHSESLLEDRVSVTEDPNPL